MDWKPETFILNSWIELLIFPLTILFKKTYLLLILLCTITGCGGNPQLKPEIRQLRFLPSSVAILITDNQHALFKNDSLMQHAYDRLESKSWRTLSEQPGVRVVERRNLDVVRSEQHLQQLFAMDEKSAVRIGGLVGAQAVLLYHIRLPSWRDRFLVDEDSLPITFGGRLLEVETGTVLWSETVTIAPSHCHADDCWFGGKPQATLWPTLAEGIDQLVEEFSKVLPCHYSC